MKAAEEQDDDFFGDQTEDFWGTCEQGQGESTQQAATIGLAQRDARSEGEQFRNIGYLEAYDETKELKLQEGFEEGYKQYFQEAMKLGEHLGQTTSPLRDDLSKENEENVKRIVRSVRCLLVDVDKEEEPTTTPESLAALTRELKELSFKKP